MDPKRLLQTRIDFLTELIQAGKRLSADTITKLTEIMQKMQDLMGEDGDDDKMGQAWTPAHMGLVQSMVTGDSIDESYEAMLRRIERTLNHDRNLAGGYKYVIATMPTWVVFSTEKYETGVGYTSEFYRADWTEDATGITFTNVEQVDIKRVVVAMQQSMTQDKPLVTGPPTHRMIEQDGKPPFLIQMLPGSFVLHQAKTPGGLSSFSGVATHGNVLNQSDPPMVYPTEVWAQELPRVKELIAQGRFHGTLGHKMDAQGNPRLPEPHELSHKFTSMTQQGDLFVFEADILKTQAGQELEALLQSGVGLDNSTVATGSVSKGNWNGQSAYIVSPDNFTWHAVDVVVQGASPGSAITEVRLQSLGATQKESGKMDPEEIKQLIEQASKSGNEALVTQLQALSKTVEGLATQKLELSTEDRELLQSVKQMQADSARISARDTKVTEIVAAMVQAKEIPAQFQGAASEHFKEICQKAEDVDGKKARVLELMKPFLEQHELLQSKGFYVPEYKEDGTTKKQLNNPHEVIEDIIQSRIATGVLVDNGKDDPSNPVRNVRVQLQELAREKPVYPQAYARYQQKQFARPNDFRDWLHQNFPLTQTGEFTTADIEDAIPFIMGIVTDMNPQLVAARYASIQPTTRSKFSIVTWVINNEDGQNIKDVDSGYFTGSYANDPGEKATIKKLQGGLSTASVEPIAKKLAYDMSVEVMRRLRTDWGMDASGILTYECAAEIAREWNYNHLQSMVSGATAGNWTYGKAIPSDSSFDGEQWQKQIINYLATVRAGIRKKTFSPTVAFLGDTDAITRITWLAKEVGSFTDKGDGTGSIARGVDIQGSLTTGEDLVAVDWWESLGVPNKILAIARGNEWYRTGFVIAPYLSLYVTDEWVDPLTLDVERGMLSEVAEKMVNGDFFGTLSITSAAGTPL